METKSIQTTAVVVTPEALKAHWQGHRRLTRRVIEAFPEKDLFNFSIGGMRTFADLAREMMGVAGIGLRGLVTGNWEAEAELDYYTNNSAPTTKEELLRRWDMVTEMIDTLWPQLPIERFQDAVMAFGQYETTVWGSIFYSIDNENHHRGQGYVYLRALGIEPPPFWDR